MTVYIGVGSNINADANIIKALSLLKDIMQVTAASTFYETIPEKGKRQVNYINGVLAAETNIPPRGLRRRLRRIEKKLGRKRGKHIDSYASRVVDLDILLYGSRIIKRRNLEVPDRHILKRAFLSRPLMELDPDLTIPGDDRRVSDIAKSTSTVGMHALKGVTAEIRRNIIDE